jgi:ribosome-associated protein
METEGSGTAEKLSQNIRERGLKKEILFTATKSSGPGGQNVNKVNTRVELRFPVIASLLLSDVEKNRIMVSLNRFISKDSSLILVCQDERSQYMNKVKVTEKFYMLLENALIPPKKRRKTRPTASSRAKRLDDKRMQASKKIQRRIGDPE